MARPKKDEPARNKKLWVRCTLEQYKNIGIWAKEKGVPMGEIVISRLFDIGYNSTV